MYKSARARVFISLGKYLGAELPGVMVSVCFHLRNCHMVFRSGSTILCSHQCFRSFLIKVTSFLTTFFLFFLSVDAWTLAFSPDSQYLATGTHVGKVNIFGVESGKKEYSLDTRGKFILSIAYVRKLCPLFSL